MGMACCIRDLVSALTISRETAWGQTGTQARRIMCNISNPSRPSASVIAVDTIWTLNDTDWNTPLTRYPRLHPDMGYLRTIISPAPPTHDVD